MSAMSNHLEAAIGNLTLRGVAYTPPGDVYLALATASIGDDNVTANETTYTNYARQPMRNAGGGETVSGQFTAPDSNGTMRNAYSITFPAVGGASQVTITHWAIYDAPTGGNLLYHGAVTQSKTLDPNDVPSFPPNSISVTFN